MALIGGLRHTPFMSRAVMLFGHADHNPETPTFNERLAEAYRRGYEAKGGTVERIDLTRLSFDPVLRTGFREQQPLEPDLLHAKRSIEQATHLVWVFPTYWASPPAVVRGFFDRLFLPGWAFRYEGGNPLPKGLLSRRSARVIVTMDSPAFWYTMINFRPIHRSFGGASLKFCGLAPVKFTTVYNVRGLVEPKRAGWCDKLAVVGAADAAR